MSCFLCRPCETDAKVIIRFIESDSHRGYNFQKLNLSKKVNIINTFCTQFVHLFRGQIFMSLIICFVQCCWNKVRLAELNSLNSQLKVAMAVRIILTAVEFVARPSPETLENTFCLINGVQAGACSVLDSTTTSLVAFAPIVPLRCVCKTRIWNLEAALLMQKISSDANKELQNMPKARKSHEAKHWKSSSSSNFVIGQDGCQCYSCY